MNKHLNNDINKYIKDIKSYLICDYKTQKKFMDDFKNDVFSYIDDNSIDDINEIYEHFGLPQEIANGFFENADTKKIKKKMNISKTITICFIIALIIWATGVTVAVVDAHTSTGYFVEETHDKFLLEDIFTDSIGENV